ncbi:MAG: L,D-transpeptidase family protein [Burkholderiales bacterium]|nr:L,D-transpeptidase family protein [Burkholderiales bacterium]
MRLRRGLSRALLAGALGLTSVFLLLPEPAQAEQSTDDLLGKVFEAIEGNHLDQAFSHVEALLRAKPNFRLAYLIKGDLLLARGRAIKTFGNAPQGSSRQLDDLRAEALVRLHAYRDRPSQDRVPRYLMQLREDQRYAIVVDNKRSRLYLYQNENGRPRFVADYYISTGKRSGEKTREGDEKTPVGVYHVTASLPRSKLSDFYGSGAYPISYPNEWDKRHGRNGHGIWLHGTPSDTYSRAPRASNGCVVLANADLDALSKKLQVGLTPVIISEQVEWLSLDDWNAERNALNAEIERWRSDWESLDTERYLTHYSKKFSAGRETYSDWGRHKRQVNGGKRWIKLGLSNFSVFRNPGKDELVVVTFDQDYRSNNLSNTMKKRQYWTKEGGKWRIIYEGAA